MDKKREDMINELGDKLRSVKAKIDDYLNMHLDSKSVPSEEEQGDWAKLCALASELNEGLRKVLKHASEPDPHPKEATITRHSAKDASITRHKKTPQRGQYPPKRMG